MFDKYIVNVSSPKAVPDREAEKRELQAKREQAQAALLEALDREAREREEEAERRAAQSREDMWRKPCILDLIECEIRQALDATGRRGSAIYAGLCACDELRDDCRMLTRDEYMQAIEGSLSYPGGDASALSHLVLAFWLAREQWRKYKEEAENHGAVIRLIESTRQLIARYNEENDAASPFSFEELKYSSPC